MIALLLTLIPTATEPLKVPDKAEKDLSGIYYLEGKLQGTYTGAVTILKARDIYIVTYANAGGGATVGTGIRQGKTLSVGWTTGGKAGITIYQIEGKTLSGTWATWPGDGRHYRETLTYLRDLPPAEDDE